MSPKSYKPGNFKKNGHDSSFPSSKRGFILDKVHPSDFLNMNLIYCCEQCTHFDKKTNYCTLGLQAKNHNRERQLQLYNLSGRMALCRSVEID